MLIELSVRDLGVIAEARLLFGAGLTAVTGETGAGKTLLVEAIGLLVGERADSTLVRSGAAEATVEGRFLIGDEEVVLSRVVPADGRSRAYVNGRLATVAELAEHGRAFVDLHGQHAHQSLLAGTTQRAALDRFAAVDVAPLVQCRQRIRGLEDALAGLGGDARARARELDLLRYQVDELNRAELSDPSEDDRLGAEEDALAGVEAHREAGEGAAANVLGDDGARDALAAAVGLLAGRAPFAAVHDRLASLSVELDDALDELRSGVEALEEDPERLDAVRLRRHLLHELRRKFGETLADVIAYRDEVTTRLADLESHDERVAELEAELVRARSAEGAAAEAVGRARRARAPDLALAVQHHLTELAMPKARMQVSVSRDPEGREVTFELAANPGDPSLPMARVASGGELARAMLALRLVLTEAPDTLLFDEVDAGVGGEAALAVGAALARLGQRHQVLVVTHLAQVAAFAEHQIVVDKREVGERTLAEARPVDGEDRVIELARMLSGLSASGSARRHALELLDGARAAGQLMSTPTERVVVQAPVRLGRRTKDLVKQLLPGEIAVIDHADLDRVAAEGLVEADAAAVLNTATSMTGRYPNYGPLLVVAAGTVLVDDLGADLFDMLDDGDIVTVVDNEIWRGEEQLATGLRREVHELEAHIEDARHTLGDELEKFATNTLQYLKRERHLATDSPDLPPVRVSFKDRHALVVVRGVDYREDLAALKRSGYLREVKPVRIGVDGGADALLELGLKPDIIMGDFDSVSDDALRCGAELIVHAYLDGKAPGADRLDALGLEHEQFETAGTSEDIAMLLAHEMGAELIVAVGTHNSMEEFLDKGRAGMASTFLVRLRVGASLVDAKGVNRLYRPVVKTRDVTVLVFGALAALLAVTLVNEPLRLWLRSLWTYLRSGLG